MCIGASLLGLGYGTYQPVLYNKATFTVTSPRKSTLALSIVLMANYTAIALAPVIIDSCRSLFHAQDMTAFAFKLNFFMTAVFAVFVTAYRRSFAFNPYDPKR